MLATAGRAAEASTRWALLADTHIPADPQNQYRGFFPQENLRKIVPGVVESKPDAVLIDGDLARLEGLAADYDTLKRLLEPVIKTTPVALTLGNHDNRTTFQSSFAGSIYGTPHSVKDRSMLVIERAPVRVILLDSLFMTNQVPGLLGKAQRTWLESYLAQAKPMPTLVFVHHTLSDDDGALLDAQYFLPIIKKSRLVKAVFYGHSHVYAQDKMDDVHLINLPAVGYNFNDSQPVGWVDATFTAEGAELTLHAIGGNRAADLKTVSLHWRG